MKRVIFLAVVLLFTACEERAEPVVIKRSKVQIPLACLKLNTLNMENELLNTLSRLYPFEESCNNLLSLKFKKDIVCNSSYNAGMKSMGKFPKSFIELSVRQGLTPVYSYYVDLFHNANSEDVEEGFARLKKDILFKR